MSRSAELPAHGQRAIVLADGSQLVTCRKEIEEGARAMALYVPGLFRLDVTSHPDNLALAVRNLSGGRLLDAPAARLVDAAALPAFAPRPGGDPPVQADLAVTAETQWGTVRARVLLVALADRTRRTVTVTTQAAVRPPRSAR